MCKASLPFTISGIILKGNSVEIHQKIKIELLCDPASHLQSCLQKSGSVRDVCMLMFIAILFVIAKIWKQPKYPLAEWIKKVVYVYTNKILHTHTQS